MTELAALRVDLHNTLRVRLLLAGYQASDPVVIGNAKRAFLATYFGTETSKTLTADDLRRGIDIAKRFNPPPPGTTYTGGQPSVSRSIRSMLAAISEGQRKAIVRLGLYVLGVRYGKEYFWKMLPEWTQQYSQRRVRRIEHLTQAEAAHVIAVMEKIEARMHHEK